MLDDSQWAQLLDGFLAEARELIQRAEESLSILEADAGDQEAINALFRSAHTIKGSAGLLGLEAIVAFTHEFENVLMGVRDGDQPLTSDLLRLSFRCMDHIAALIDEVESGAETSSLSGSELLEALADYQQPVQASDTDATAGERNDSDLVQGPWHLSLRFAPSLFISGFDPASFVRYLDQVGRIRALEFVADQLPRNPEDFDPEHCHFGLEMQVEGFSSRAELEDVFEFVRDLADIRILAPASGIEDYVALVQALPEEDLRLGDMLVRIGALDHQELQAALDRQQRDSDSKRLGEHLVAAQSVATPVVEAALDKQRRVREKKRGDSGYLRVAADKMDTLINQVGELIIAAAGARILAGEGQDDSLRESLEEVHLHVERIREAALQLRMVEIGDTFNRFHRLVRDSAEALDKDIQLRISGADTELDKTLVDRIYEPLVHLVRNAMDHGLESAVERQAAGKPMRGTVCLNAYHAAGSIVIEVSDDGRGIDPQRLRDKAIAREMIASDSELDERQLLQLIFAPGFSTAEEVTNLSGRGVGMDSVRRDIDALRGTVEIDNSPGQGCCFRIRLPLTLAIIEGFLVSIDDQFFVVPLEAVDECIEAATASANWSGYQRLRGHPLPYLNLKQLFGQSRDSGAASAPDARSDTRALKKSMVVVRHGGEAAGLLVDRLHGEIQTVIKPLGPLFDHLSGLSGATILGSGKVALILDVPGLLRHVTHPEGSEAELSAPLVAHRASPPQSPCS